MASGGKADCHTKNRALKGRKEKETKLTPEGAVSFQAD